MALERCSSLSLITVDLEYLHLMSVARTPVALVLDINSCNRLAGCRRSDVTAQGHERVVVEVIDATWARSPHGSGGTIWRWSCREDATK